MNRYFTYLEKRDPGKGQYRFYALHLAQSLFGNWTLIREWGRIGSPGRMVIEWFDSFEEAQTAMDHKAHEKLRKGYQDITDGNLPHRDNVTG